MSEHASFPVRELVILAQRDPTQWSPLDAAWSRQAVLKLITDPKLLNQYLDELTASADPKLKPFEPILGLAIWTEFELRLPDELMTQILEGGAASIEQLTPQQLSQLLRCPVGLQELEELIGSTAPAAWLPTLLQPTPGEPPALPQSRRAIQGRSEQSFAPVLALAFSLLLNFGMLGYWFLSPPNLPRELTQLSGAEVQRGANARGPLDGFTLNLQANRAAFATLVLATPNQRLSIVPGPGEDLLKLEPLIKREWPIPSELIQRQASVIVILTQQPAHLLLEERLKLDPRPAEAIGSLPSEIEALLKSFGYESPAVRWIELPRPTP